MVGIAGLGQPFFCFFCFLCFLPIVSIIFCAHLSCSSSDIWSHLSWISKRSTIGFCGESTCASNSEDTPASLPRHRQRLGRLCRATGERSVIDRWGLNRSMASQPGRVGEGDRKGHNPHVHLTPSRLPKAGHARKPPENPHGSPDKDSHESPSARMWPRWGGPLGGRNPRDAQSPVLGQLRGIRAVAPGLHRRKSQSPVWLVSHGAGGGSRNLTPLRIPDFESIEPVR